MLFKLFVGGINLSSRLVGETAQQHTSISWPWTGSLFLRFNLISSLTELIRSQLDSQFEDHWLFQCIDRLTRPYRTKGSVSVDDLDESPLTIEDWSTLTEDHCFICPSVA